MKHHRARAVCVGLVLGLALTACASGARPARAPALPGRWVQFRPLAGVVDLAGPRSDGSYAVAAAGRLFIMSQAGALTPFARGNGGYTAAGGEPYLTLAGTGQVAATRCSFRSGTIFALEPGRHPGVILIGEDGRARRFVSLPAADFPDGITFDSAGHFGHRLLVSVRKKTQTAVLGIDCAGGVRTIAANVPEVEGGIVVAPLSFGSYGGDLVAPDELSGGLYAIQPDGTVVTLALSGLPHGQDIGVESAGFIPPGFGASDAAFLADRLTPGNRHPGTNSILRLPGSELIKAGARAGDLLIATEAGARTIIVRCASSCTVRYIAIGPGITHAEGHITFPSVGS